MLQLLVILCFLLHLKHKLAHLLKFWNKYGFVYLYRLKGGHGKAGGGVLEWDLHSLLQCANGIPPASAGLVTSLASSFVSSSPTASTSTPPTCTCIWVQKSKARKIGKERWHHHQLLIGKGGKMVRMCTTIDYLLVLSGHYVHVFINLATETKGKEKRQRKTTLPSISNRKKCKDGKNIQCRWLMAAVDQVFWTCGWINIPYYRSQKQSQKKQSKKNKDT